MTLISYPNVQARKAKADKTEKIYQSYNLKDISDDNIVKEVLSARQDALKSLEDLGVTVKLDEKVSTDPLKTKDLEMQNEVADKEELLISEMNQQWSISKVKSILKKNVPRF